VGGGGDIDEFCGAIDVCIWRGRCIFWCCATLAAGGGCVLLCGAVCCGMLLRVAVCYGVLECVARRCVLWCCAMLGV